MLPPLPTSLIVILQLKLAPPPSRPIARLIVDFLLIVLGDREPDAYTRFMDTLTLAGAAEEGETRARLQGFVDERRTRFRSGPLLQLGSLQKLIQNLFTQVSPESIASLSSEYGHGDYLEKMIDQTVERIKALRKLNEDLLAALGRVSEDRSVRIMTIHKSQAGTGRWHSLVLAQLLSSEDRSYVKLPFKHSRQVQC